MKIVLILLDGMRPDSLSGISYAEEILKNSQYTMNAETVFPSVTLPCHISLFHSVDPSRHGTTTNIYAPQVRPIKGLFEVLNQAGKSSAIFYDWEEIRDVARPDSMMLSQYMSGRLFGYDKTSDALTARAIEELKQSDYDFTFLYMCLPDYIGHTVGWMTEEYINSLRHCFENIKKLKESLGDEYLFILTADHGGHDRIHGTSLPEDMMIPIIVFGNDENVKFNFENANIKDIAPTASELLGVSPDPEWEGKSLLRK